MTIIGQEKRKGERIYSRRRNISLSEISRFLRDKYENETFTDYFSVKVMRVGKVSCLCEDVPDLERVFDERRFC